MLRRYGEWVLIGIGIIIILILLFVLFFQPEDTDAPEGTLPGTMRLVEMAEAV